MTYELVMETQEVAEDMSDWTEICVCHGEQFRDRMALLEHQVRHFSDQSAGIAAENKMLREGWASRMLMPGDDVLKVLEEENGIISALQEQRDKQVKQQRILDRQKEIFDQQVGKFYATRDRIKAEFQQQRDTMDQREVALRDREAALAVQQ